MCRLLMWSGLQGLTSVFLLLLLARHSHSRRASGSSLHIQHGAKVPRVLFVRNKSDGASWE